jgi:hypothetical protein
MADFAQALEDWLHGVPTPTPQRRWNAPALAMAIVLIAVLMFLVFR